MALDTTTIDINRNTSGLTLTPEMSGEIFAKTLEQSAVMQLARRIDLPGRGLSIPVVTGEPSADFVVESTEKPVSNSTFETKTITPYKICVIELFSDEFRRDYARLYDELVRRLPYAISKKIDSTVFTGTAPGTGFDVLTGADAVQIGSATVGADWQALVNGYTDIAQAGYAVDGFALSPAGEGKLLGAVDGQSRPLFIPGTEGATIGNILGARTVRARGAYNATAGTVGFMGDWTQARFGMVEDIDLSISEEATINNGTKQINLWQRNMFAVKAEVEVGFIVSDTDAFKRLTVVNG